MLKANEIECRIQTVTKNGCSILLYKTARVDAKYLDETYGAMNWKNDYKIIDGVLYSTISVWNKDIGEWVTKCDCGVESYTQAEKGRASDAFKRAGFKWGIGAELYTAPFIWIPAGALKTLKNTEKKDKHGNDIWTCRDRFEVKLIDYDDDGKISKLQIYNSNTKKVVYEIGIEHSVPDIPTLESKIKLAKLTKKDLDSFLKHCEVEKIEDLTDDQKVELETALTNKIKEIKDAEQDN